jgi:hypothetical protein
MVADGAWRQKTTGEAAAARRARAGRWRRSVSGAAVHPGQGAAGFPRNDFFPEILNLWSRKLDLLSTNLTAHICRMWLKRHNFPAKCQWQTWKAGRTT